MMKIEDRTWLDKYDLMFLASLFLSPFILIIFAFVFNAYSKPTVYKKAYKAKVLRVYDGDTFFVDLKCDFKIACKNIPIRVAGIDTPEIRGSEKVKGLLAQNFVENLLMGAKKVELRNLKRGKYFRIVADVYFDDKNLAELLLKEGYAVEYHGGKK